MKHDGSGISMPNIGSYNFGKSAPRDDPLGGYSERVENLSPAEQDAAQRCNVQIISFVQGS